MLRTSGKISYKDLPITCCVGRRVTRAIQAFQPNNTPVDIDHNEANVDSVKNEAEYRIGQVIQHDRMVAFRWRR